MEEKKKRQKTEILSEASMKRNMAELSQKNHMPCPPSPYHRTTTRLVFTCLVCVFVNRPVLDDGKKILLIRIDQLQTRFSILTRIHHLTRQAGQSSDHHQLCRILHFRHTELSMDQGINYSCCELRNCGMELGQRIAEHEGDGELYPFHLQERVRQ